MSTETAIEIMMANLRAERDEAKKELEKLQITHDAACKLLAEVIDQRDDSRKANAKFHRRIQLMEGYWQRKIKSWKSCAHYMMRRGSLEQIETGMKIERDRIAAAITHSASIESLPRHALPRLLKIIHDPDEITQAVEAASAEVASDSNVPHQ
jgi:hypothetical protein